MSAKNHNFIEQIIQQDLNDKKYEQIRTRFPPEPNGYLHIGHAKSICLNFGLAKTFHGLCYLRFDDTNPEKEEEEYVNAIQKDVQWLGFQWDGEVRYASSYFDTLYQWALHLIKKGLAYVDEQTPDELRNTRGTLTSPGQESLFRQRSIEENIACFEKMRAGEYSEGAAVLRAKIDMSHANINMRDPVLYRIIKKAHHQTKDKWCIYPSYDFAHGQEDAIEGITHSLCTLEFADHRPLYDWFIENLPVPCQPKQYEFSPLKLSYTITSKRKLKQLIDDKIVQSWDDPRLPTLSGLRRRGVPAEVIRRFCDMIGVTKSEGVVDISMFEFILRETLNKQAPRAMAVLDPIKFIIKNYPAGTNEKIRARSYPQDENNTIDREIFFSREIYIDRADFMEIKPNKKWKRLYLGGEVRLRNSYIIHCDDVEKNSHGEIIALHGTYDPNTLGKDPQDRKVKGVIHWVDGASSILAKIFLYDRLFNDETPDAHKDQLFTDFINPQSLKVIDNARIENSLLAAEPDQVYQFEREGYFCLDCLSDKKNQKLQFNRTISLKDSWAKIASKQ